MKNTAEVEQEPVTPSPPPSILGTCTGCGRGIPVGYLAVVTKWKSVQYGTTTQKLCMMVPEVVYCRECSVQVESPKMRRRRFLPPGVQEEQEEAPVVELTAKEIAMRLYTVMGAVPHGSKKLAQMADLEYSDLILEILKRLRAAGKVQLIEGRWARA